MALEIERKFIVTGTAWQEGADRGRSIIQGYLVAQPDRSLRVRIADEADATLTLKFGGPALVRDEFEYGIPLDDARQMLAQAVGRPIEKHRYRRAEGDITWEIDVFSGALSGLVIAEIELPRVDHPVPQRPWLGREVTGLAAYTNQGLALEGLPEDRGA